MSADELVDRYGVRADAAAEVEAAAYALARATDRERTAIRRAVAAGVPVAHVARLSGRARQTVRAMAADHPGAGDR